MKIKSRFGNRSEERAEHIENRHESAEIAEFHHKRIKREEKIETNKESLTRPAGTDEYQQLIAEDASLNAKPMIEEAAFYLAEQREFAPGGELNDWLRAEADIENTLRSKVAAPPLEVVEDRRDTVRRF